MICLLGGVYKRLQVLGKKRGTTISIVKQKTKMNMNISALKK